MRTLLVVLCLVSSLLLGQEYPGLPFPLPESVRTYVGLSEEQVARITALTAESYAAALKKTLREVEVRQEIELETKRATPDPMALGLRYVELEVIRREVAAEKKKTVAAVQALLTETQKAKVGVLERTLKDYGTACVAAGWNLLEEPSTLAGENPDEQVPAVVVSLCGGGRLNWYETQSVR